MREFWTCFIIIKSENGSRSHMIEKPSFTLGRTQEADLPLLASSISRVHLHVEIEDGGIWICDKDSSNGTFLNGRPLQPGARMPVGPEDVVKLGLEEEEFQFKAIPKPMELLDEKARSVNLKDSMLALAQKLDVKSKAKVGRELERARIEAERIIAEASKKAEIQQTQMAVEIQNQKQALDDEINKQRQRQEEELTRERLKARREADEFIAEAQRTIQRDYDESGRRIENQLSEVRSKASEIRQQAEISAREILEEAREEAVRVRLQATEEARTINKEALRKSEESLNQLQENFERNVAEKRAEIQARARADAEKEADRILREVKHSRSELEENLQKLETLGASRSDLENELQELSRKKSEAGSSLDQLKAEMEELRLKLKDVEDLETRRHKAGRELDSFVKSREEGLAKVDKEIKDLREQRLLEFENTKREQEEELKKDRLKAIEAVQKAIEREQEQFLKTKKLRAIEVSQAIYDRLVPEIQGWLKNPEGAATDMRVQVDTAIRECFLNQESSLEMVSTVAPDSPATTVEMRDKKILKVIGLCLMAAVLVGGLFREALWRAIQGHNQSSYSSERIERIRTENLYQPNQDDIFRDTYTDNVLYMRGYFDKKTDSTNAEKWILRLNHDLDLLRSMSIGEEEIIQVVSKETNLVKRLGVMRESIDKRYLDQGLESMRKAEEDQVGELIGILKGRANYMKYRAVERDFLGQLK
jgi:pSer/pThr/pTyr-binding forkhead associated (FHA) protein